MKAKAHLVIELDAAIERWGPVILKVVSAGIYSDDHMNLTRNLKRVGATVFSAEAETYSEAEEKVMAWVRQMDQGHLHAWKQLAKLLEKR